MNQQLELFRCFRATRNNTPKNRTIGNSHASYRVEMTVPPMEQSDAKSVCPHLGLLFIILKSMCSVSFM
jgi:hypothetical protein